MLDLVPSGEPQRKFVERRRVPHQIRDDEQRPREKRMDQKPPEALERGGVQKWSDPFTRETARQPRQQRQHRPAEQQERRSHHRQQQVLHHVDDQQPAGEGIERGSERDKDDRKPAEKRHQPLDRKPPRNLRVEAAPAEKIDNRRRNEPQSRNRFESPRKEHRLSGQACHTKHTPGSVEKIGHLGDVPLPHHR